MVYDYCIVGGGIVGLSTALELLRAQPDAGVLVLEKEDGLGLHQTGHNSGVIHAGIYYKPKSLKAELCRIGETATKEFCTENGIPFKTPGKLIVATNQLELSRMINLQANAELNSIPVERLDQAELKRIEPNVFGVGALRVPSTGIVDYQKICEAMGGIIAARGGEVLLGVRVDKISDQSHVVRVESSEKSWQAKKVITCCGLQSDRMVTRSGMDAGYKIVPFRGEYYMISPEKRNIVEHLIYPVPDPELPFLGIHLTPMIDGSLTVGPNAVLGFAREGYPKFSVNIRDMLSYACYPAFWKAIKPHLRSGMEEMRDSISKKSYLQKCRKYCPDLQLEDLLPWKAGIRAQAVSSSGEMVHDFLFLQSERILHVGNAPSPAATSALPIGRMIAERVSGARQ